jgi:CDP-diacylglycerol--serine O-phosphatidyltransferase
MQKLEREVPKIAFFLPNSFTALNMFCGFISMIYSINGNYYYACLILLLGAIFDSVDGRVARLTGTQSPFGEQFDSLSDAISFGVAPAMLLYHKFFSQYGKLGIATAFFFSLCGALRLARFNANIDKVSSNYFQGLPIPAGALAIVGYVLFSLEYPFLSEVKFFNFIYSYTFSLLMISNIPFYSFKGADVLKKHKKKIFFGFMLFVVVIYIYEHLILGPLIVLYVLGCLTYYFTHKGELKNMFHWEGEKESEN